MNGTNFPMKSYENQMRGNDPSQFRCFRTDSVVSESLH